MVDVMCGVCIFTCTMSSLMFCLRWLCCCLPLCVTLLHAFSFPFFRVFSHEICLFNKRRVHKVGAGQLCKCICLELENEVDFYGMHFTLCRKWNRMKVYLFRGFFLVCTFLCREYTRGPISWSPKVTWMKHPF